MKLVNLSMKKDNPIPPIPTQALEQIPTTTQPCQCETCNLNREVIRIEEIIIQNQHEIYKLILELLPERATPTQEELLAFWQQAQQQKAKKGD